LFHGEPDKAYAVYSAANVQLNARFARAPADKAALIGADQQFISELVLRVGGESGHSVRITSGAAHGDDDDALRLNATYDTSYVGCFDISAGELSDSSEQQTLGACSAHCAAHGFAYAGLSQTTAAQSCACFQRGSSALRLRPIAYCYALCNGDKKRTCGSDQGMSLYVAAGASAQLTVTEKRSSAAAAAADDSVSTVLFPWTHESVDAHHVFRTVTVRTHLFTLEVFTELYNEHGVRFPVLNFRFAAVHDAERFSFAEGIVGQTCQGKHASSIYAHLGAGAAAAKAAEANATAFAAGGGGGGMSSAGAFASSLATYPLRGSVFLYAVGDDAHATKFAYGMFRE
jgi:hypothetical protein